MVICLQSCTHILDGKGPTVHNIHVLAIASLDYSQPVVGWMVWENLLCLFGRFADREREHHFQQGLLSRGQAFSYPLNWLIESVVGLV